MSEFFPNDDPELEEAVSVQPLEMSMLVSPVLRDELGHLFGVEQIINGYDHKIENIPRQNGSRRLFSSILLAGMTGALVFFLGQLLLGLASTEKKIQDRTMFLSKQFPGLERTFASNNPEIIAVLDQLSREGNTPAHYLDRSKVPSHEIVKTMDRDFRALDWGQHLDQLRTNIHREPWSINYQSLKENAGFLANYQKGILDIRQKIKHPDPVFHPEFELTKYGFSIKASVVEDLWGYVHMEEYEIARALLGMSWSDIKQAAYPYPGVEASLDQAVESLAGILEVAHLASLQKDLALRLHVAYIRENAFDILQQIVNCPDFKQCHAQKLFYLMCGHLKLWPGDVVELEGERLSSFYLYEAARKGDFFSVISHEDKKALQTVGDQEEIKAWLSKEMIDQDQIFYLQTMREIIACSNEDYFKQKNVLDRIEQEILANQQGGKHCIIADFLLLRGIRKIKKTLAVDKERVSEMVIALGSTLRLPIPAEAMIDPVDGKQFLVKEFGAFESDSPIPIVTVSNTEGNLSFTVPTKLAVVSQR